MVGWAIYLAVLTSVPELPGGPDGFGYRWVRSLDPGGPSFNWIDATTGQRYTFGDDQTRWVSVPFSFWFYNNQYADSIAICSNGWISFNTATPNAPPFSWPDPVFGAALSVFGTDLYFDTVYVKVEGSMLIVEWLNAQLTAGSGTFTFEVILDNSDSSITFQYLSHQGVDWTAYGYSFVGIQNTGANYSLSVSTALLQDSLAIRFYYEPEHDLSVQLVYPGDSYLLLGEGEDSVRFSITNSGITAALNVPIVCTIYDGSDVVFCDTTVVPSISVNNIYSGTFTGWFRRKSRVYRIVLEADTANDPFPENNVVQIYQKVGAPASDSIPIFDGTPAGGVYYTSQFQAFGVEINPDTLPFLLNYIGVWLISPGDPGWPQPDTTIDPAVVEIWLGDTMPQTRVYVDTLVRDNSPPGWVYSIITDSLIVWNEKFWVVVRTRLNSQYGIEALAYDSALEYPSLQWVQRRDGSWRREEFAPGDPILFVAGTPVELTFRGDLWVDYAYPAWSHVVRPGQPDSVLILVGNSGPYSVSGISLTFSLRDTEEAVVADTIDIPSLAVNSVDTLWFGPFVIHEEYDSLMLNCAVSSSQDSVLNNNMIQSVIRAVGVANDTFKAGNPPVVASYDLSDTTQRIAVEVPVDTPRSYLKYVALWLVSPGDTCYPVGDTTVDPIIVEVWRGDSLPGQIVYVDTLRRDNEPPGWVFWIPPESIEVQPSMWIAFRIALPQRHEAIGLDSLYENEGATWEFVNGYWHQSPQLSGDLVVWIYRDVTGNGISEDASNLERFGFLNRSTISFSDNYRFSFGLVSDGKVTLEIFDVAGRRIKTLQNGFLKAGRHFVTWNLTDQNGAKVPSGVYIALLQAGSRKDILKFVVVH